MRYAPNFEQVPTKDQILNTWNNMPIEFGDGIIYEGAKKDKINIQDFITQDRFEVNVLFGPIPSLPEYVNDIEARLMAGSNYVSKAELITNYTGNPNDKNEIHLFYLPVKFYLDVDKIRKSDNSKIGTDIFEKVNFEIYYKKSNQINNINAFLSRKYNFDLILNTSSVLKVLTPLTNPALSGNKQKWSISLKSDNKLFHRVTLDSITCASGIPFPFANSMKIVLEQETNNPFQWNLNLEGDLVESTVNYGESLSYVLHLSVQRNSGEKSLLRRLSVDLPVKYKKPANEKTETIGRKTIDELLKANPKVILPLENGEEINTTDLLNMKEEEKGKKVEELKKINIIYSENGLFFLKKE